MLQKLTFIPDFQNTCLWFNSSVARSLPHEWRVWGSNPTMIKGKTIFCNFYLRSLFLSWKLWPVDGVSAKVITISQVTFASCSDCWFCSLLSYHLSALNSNSLNRWLTCSQLNLIWLHSSNLFKGFCCKRATGCKDNLELDWVREDAPSTLDFPYLLDGMVFYLFGTSWLTTRDHPE